MADDSVNVINPKTGEKGALPREKLARAKETGSRPMTGQERAATLEARQTETVAKDFAGQQAAGAVGKFRGVGEAFGVPADQLATDAASLFGQRERTAAYLKMLEEEHPYASGLGEIGGNVFGAVAQGGGGAAAALEKRGLAASMGRIAKATGSHALRGGIENTVIGTTHDLNEAALGDPNVAGQKIYSSIPKHFGVGVVAGGLLGGGGAALAEIGRPLAEKGAAAADRAASAAVGREVGEKGEAAVRAGEHLRGPRGEVPRNARELIDILEGRQGAARGATEGEAAARASSLEDAQTRAAAELSARQEAARKGVAKASGKGVQAAEAARSSTLLDVMGAAGERVERAEVAAGEVAGKFRGEGLQARMAEAGRQIDDVANHYNVLRNVLGEEKRGAQEAFEHLAEERAANTKALQEAIAALKKGGADHPELTGLADTDFEAVAGAMGRGDHATVRENMEASLGMWRGIGPEPRGQPTTGRWPKVPDAERGPFGRAKVEPFSAEEIAGHEKELRVRPSRAEEFVPIKALKNAEVWEPAKIESLRAQKDLPPIRVTVGEDGVATVEDGIHRVALAKERGMTHVPAVVTRYAPLGRPKARWRSPLVENAARMEAELLAGQGSGAAQREIERLTAISTDLEKAYAGAAKHLDDLDLAATALEQQAERDTAAMARQADAQIRTFQRQGQKEVSAAEGAIERERAAGQKEVSAAEKKSSAEVAAAEKKAAAERAGFEKGATKEKKGLERAQEKERAALPAPSKETPYDPWLNAARERADATAPLVSPTAGFGALMALTHGNLAGAGAALLSSFAANRARAAGNLAAARALRELSLSLSAVDRGLRSKAASAIGAGARTAGTRAADRDRKPAKVSFEKAVAGIEEARGRPQVIEARVTAAMGPWVKQAPQVFASAMATSIRAQLFLESKLPRPQRDPYSLTPHLEPGDIPDSQKYDFLVFVGAIDDPTILLDGVKDGSISPQQVEAVEAVYPDLYADMRAEVDYEIRQRKKPMPYELGIHVGTLLGIQTDEVLSPRFQMAQAAAYAAKVEQGAPVGSRSPSAESKVSKSMMSTSQRVEAGGE